jgi:hypothetical protein
MEKEPADSQNEAVDEEQFTLAIFPVSRYLEDAALRQAVIELTKNPSGIKQADSQTLIPFRPLPMDALKQKQDMDVYCLLGIHGMLVRTRVVTTGSVARTNPPPDGYLCDSCHVKGWLKQDFQDSKIDGANISVWLCPACSKLEPEERDVRF